MDDPSFCDYCIVCDRAIVAPKEPEPVKAVKKKPAAGTIRIKNPDGTVTTRTANGQKTTRPPLRRGPNSANRLAAVAAANNNAAAKMQPLTRSKTAEPPASQPIAEASGTSPASASASASTSTSTASAPGADKVDSPEGTILKTPSSTKSEPPYVSTIYCSRACAEVEITRSSDFARRLSYDHGSSSSLQLITSGLSDRRSPYAPPSPLFISESDTSSHSDPQSAGPANAASSAPNGNAFSFFNMGRDGADDAWKDVNRQRRSSVHPTIAVRPVAMAREPSQASTIGSAVGQSSDSLNSLWTGQAGYENDLHLGRSTSGSGRIRMTPMSEYPPLYGQYQNQNQGQNQGQGAGKRSMSSSSERPGVASSRALPRSSLSQASLTASASPVEPDNDHSPIPPGFGSYPEHTLNLWNSYNSAFSHRDTGASSSSRRASRGPTPAAVPVMGTTPTSPPAFSHGGPHSQSYVNIGHLKPAAERRPSCGGLQRPLGGTIRAKSRTDVTWDSFGRDEVMAHKRRQEERLGSVELNSAVSLATSTTEHTPKQSIEIGQKGCMIRYHSSSPGDLPMCSRRSSRPGTAQSASAAGAADNETPHPGALAIPSSRQSQSSSNGPSPARTPTTMPPPLVPHRASYRSTGPSGGGSSVSGHTGAVPDLASLRINPTGCAVAAATAYPYVSADHAHAHAHSHALSSSLASNASAAMHTHTHTPTPGSSAPRPTWNWDKWEKQGGRTYEVPKGLKQASGNGKAGLFFFK